jgi:hypothetical protein
MNAIYALFLLFAQTAAPAPVPGMPSAPGIYLRQNNGKWVPLTPASISNRKTKGLGTYIETEGLSALESEFICAGAHSATRVAARKPTFYIRGVGSPGDAMLIQFVQKTDSRTLRTSSSDATFSNKGGFRKADIRNLEVTVFSDQSFSVTPQESLKPGEYLLVFGYATAGYDFGVDGS